MAKQRYLKRKARRHKVLSKAKKASAPKTVRPAVRTVDEPSSDEDDESESDEVEEVEDEGSVEPLVPFPTAVEPAGPDPRLLERQGLPAGLREANFIPSEQAPVEGLDEKLQGRLAAMGVTGFFAGESDMDELM